MQGITRSCETGGMNDREDRGRNGTYLGRMLAVERPSSEKAMELGSSR
jgi:hypothetical protein